MNAVMYHYVRPSPEQPPFEYYHLDLEDFRRQLDYLSQEYTLIDRSRFNAWVLHNATLPDDAAILTFDDGLLDHYEYVLPELKRRGLWGLFFIPGPLGNTLLPVHRIHTLLGSTTAGRLVGLLDEIVDIKDVRDSQVETFKEMYAGMDSSDNMTLFKRTLNYLLPYEKLPAILDALEAEIPQAAQVTPEDFYMSREHLSDLAEAGMIVGGHTKSHPVLSRLSQADQQAEIAESLSFVSEIATPQFLTFAYPYGSAETFNSTTQAVLRDAGCDLAFTTEPGEISADALQKEPLALSRRDCNEFPHGEASRY